MRIPVIQIREVVRLIHRPGFHFVVGIAQISVSQFFGQNTDRAVRGNCHKCYFFAVVLIHQFYKSIFVCLCSGTVIAREIDHKNFRISVILQGVKIAVNIRKIEWRSLISNV